MADIGISIQPFEGFRTKISFLHPTFVRVLSPEPFVFADDRFERKPSEWAFSQSCHAESLACTQLGERSSTATLSSMVRGSDTQKLPIVAPVTTWNGTQSTRSEGHTMHFRSLRSGGLTERRCFQEIVTAIGAFRIDLELYADLAVMTSVHNETIKPASWRSCQLVCQARPPVGAAWGLSGKRFLFC